MVRDGGESARAGVMPDLVTAGRLAMELEPERLCNPLVFADRSELEG